jgi:hypothetical protein
LTRFGSTSSSFTNAIVTTAKASFTSNRSIWESGTSAFSSAFFAANAGAVVNHSGSWAWEAKETIRPSGFAPVSCATASVARRSAAAPSLIFEEFAAVTVPSFWNAGFREPIFSSFSSGVANGSSSRSTTTVPFFPSMETGTISARKSPESFARRARW